ncbi:MAG TPA: hypothetical protein PLT99_09575 [Chitinophagales bacterium]|nr:hypothetical protein [Chitinophagales bacterium]HNJ89713.1 hypothetical protein [Chitinophagales bacterium]
MKQFPITKIAVMSMLCAFTLIACREIIRDEPDLPDNPYDDVDYGNGGPDPVLIDSASFLGLHTFIFSTTCAVPGCHDGTFEPDFRTVQSAYNSLVYAPVIKNDDDDTFTYRVVPGDTALSWLHERITTDDAVLGRMPLYDTLYPHEREMITQWILNGAPDIFGNSPILPDYQPSTYGYICYENDTTGLRLDTNRADLLQPVILPQHSNVEYWFGIYDTDESGVYQLPSWLEQYNIRISQDMLMNTGFTEYTFELEPDFDPYYGPAYYDPGIPTPYWHHFTLNTDDFETGKLYFMRLYLKDTAHDFVTELPDDSQIYIAYYFTFRIE